VLTTEQRKRYDRQVLFEPLGERGQEALRDSCVAIAGLGALGALAADMLARAGVGRLRLIDYDVVELSNLQRQILYDESDVESGRSKAELAARRLRRVNSAVDLVPITEKVTEENAEDLIGVAHLVIDGVDNFRAKFALNRATVKLGIPMIYGALSGTYALSMPIIPGETACLGCVYREEPDAASSETASTAGVIAPTVAAVVALQVANAIKLLIGARGEVLEGLAQIDVWDGDFKVTPWPRRTDCRICGECGGGGR